jgi:hypothetical protein
MGSYMILRLGLFDIKGDYTYIGISDALVKRIREEAESTFKSIRSFSEKAGIDHKLVGRMENTKRVSVRDFAKIVGVLKIGPEQFNRHVTLITSDKGSHVGIHNPRLPFDFGKKSAMRFISGILGDGSISRDGIAAYYNQRKDLIDIFRRSVSDVLGDVDFKLKLRPDDTYGLSYPKIVARVLLSVGMKWGAKAETNQSIPKFIHDLCSDSKSVFIRQFFNDEGNVRLKDRRLQVKQTIDAHESKQEVRSSAGRYAPNVLKDIRALLYDLNITSAISLGHYRMHKGKIKTDWELSIYGKENLEKFRRLIGFDLDYKSNALDECIKSYIYPSAGRNQRILYALQYSASVELKKGLVDKYLLSEATGRSVWRTTTYFMVDLLRLGFVSVLDKKKRDGANGLHWKYKITEAGWDFLRNNKENIFLEDVKKRIDAKFIK